MSTPDSIAPDPASLGLRAAWRRPIEFGLCVVEPLRGLTRRSRNVFRRLKRVLAIWTELGARQSSSASVSLERCSESSGQDDHLVLLDGVAFFDTDPANNPDKARTQLNAFAVDDISTRRQQDIAWFRR